MAFLGSALPEDMCNSSPACNIAGNKFQFQFIRALRQAYESMPTVFSVRPIGVFPNSREIWVRAARADLSEGIHCQMIPFVNVLFLKQLTIGLFNLLFLVGWLWRNRRHRCVVFTYNVYSPMSMPVMLATWLLGGKAIAVVFDFPHNISFDYSGLHGLLQRIEVFIEAKCLSRFDGIIPITKWIAEDFAPSCPVLVIEGGVDKASVESDSDMAGVLDGENLCFFGGTLNEINGIRLLMDAFRQISDPNYRLLIFGKGPLESLVREAAACDKRIVYCGFLPNDQVVRHQRRATVLLNARPSSQRIARYTFPSKLLEYMMSGRPVITTELPGIPNEYLKYVYVLRDETPEGLAQLICEVCSKPPVELAAYGQRALRFIWQNKNWNVQGKRIREFVSRL